MPPAQQMKTALTTECIKFGWETFKKRPWFLIGVTVLYIIISFSSGTISDLAGDLMATSDNFANNAVSFLISMLLNTLLGLMTVVFLLKAHDGIDHVTLSDAWNPTKYWRYLIVSILMGLAFAGGLILLIIPGIIFGLMFWFGGYLVVDRSLSPMEAMKESAHMTSGHKWELFLLAVASLGLMLIGIICLLIGFLVAIPVVTLAFTHAYRQLEIKAAPMLAPTPAA